MPHTLRIRMSGKTLTPAGGPAPFAPQDRTSGKGKPALATRGDLRPSAPPGPFVAANRRLSQPPAGPRIRPVQASSEPRSEPRRSRFGRPAKPRFWAVPGGWAGVPSNSTHFHISQSSSITARLYSGAGCPNVRFLSILAGLDYFSNFRRKRGLRGFRPATQFSFLLTLGRFSHFKRPP